MNATHSQPFTRYKVGGAVRDALLGYPSSETDWVVVGATPEQMVAAGMQPVGRDFPVFIDPASGDEYALARTERKSGHGYHGFNFYAASDVTLEQDLWRRDLTINAIAEAADGELVDPCGGRADLERKILRHVSPAFSEDPLRVLRVARFAARYHHLGFSVATETLDLMSAISASGELAHLSAERVWRETERALGERDGAVYLRVLSDCGALAALFPEWPNQAALIAAASSADCAGLTCEEKFAVIASSGQGGDSAAVEQLCRRLRTPNTLRQLAVALYRFGAALRAPREFSASQLLSALHGCGGLKSAARLDQLLRCLAALPAAPNERDSQWLKRLQAALAAISIADIVAGGASGQEIGETLQRRQLELLEAALAG